MWCKSLVWWCKISTFAPHLKHALIIELGMKGLTIVKRTNKAEGTIRLRFRLRDGRGVDLYHKSEIDADLKDLDKFADTGELKSRVSVYNKKLKLDIDTEIDAMETAYKQLCAQKDKTRITTDEFEKAITMILHPQKSVKALTEMTLIDRFSKYIDDGLRDGNFGEGRQRHYKVSLGELTRFLTIQHRLKVTPSEFDADDITDYRQFLFDEYKYVKKHKSLYDLLMTRNVPTERRDQNTVAAKMKCVQAFFNELIEKGELSISPFVHLGKNKKRTMMRESYNPPVFLLQEEFLKLKDTEVPETLQETKDAFLLQCAFGCRISEFKRLSMENIAVSDEGVLYVHYLPEKTLRENVGRKEIETPVMRFAYDIIMKYKFQFHVLKYICGKSGYNVKIKELIKYCGIDRKCAVFNDELGNNQYEPLYELASSKICRKTHVDILTKAQINMYAAGLHHEGSDAVNHYTHMDMKDRFVLMCYAYKQPLYYVNKDLKILE